MTWSIGLGPHMTSSHDLTSYGFQSLLSFSYDPSSILRIFIWYPQLWAQNFKGLPTLLVKHFRSLWSLPAFLWRFPSKVWCSLWSLPLSFIGIRTFFWSLLIFTETLYRIRQQRNPLPHQPFLDIFTPHSYSFLWALLYKRGSTSRDTFSLISSPVVRTSDSKVSPVNPTGEVSDQEECSYLWAQGSGVLSGWHLV